jgi:hypothetical protein
MLGCEKNYITRRVQAMRSLLDNPAETGQDMHCNLTGTATLVDMYATTSLTVLFPTSERFGEEELHTSFEEAISDRVLAVNKQLRNLRAPLTESLSVPSPRYSAIKPWSVIGHPGYLKNAAHEAFIKVALALMLIMVGFDLMGLLVLHMR